LPGKTAIRGRAKKPKAEEDEVSLGLILLLSIVLTLYYRPMKKLRLQRKLPQRKLLVLSVAARTLRMMMTKKGRLSP
jgi:hypothetical protein